MRKKTVLDMLKAENVPIESIVDVGVQSQTEELIDAFPDKHHFLFEPDCRWNSDIKTNYANVHHTLFPVAVSDEDKDGWVVSLSVTSNGVVTHSYISMSEEKRDGHRVVECKPSRIRRLDNYRDHFGVNFLLKIDVDGTESGVIEGAAECIGNASVVICEATWDSLSRRSRAIEDNGFELIDMVDVVIWGKTFWQCDLVFLRRDLVTESLRPANFDWKHWRPRP